MTNPVFNPLADRVVIRRAEAAEVSKGGIIIADIAKDKPQEGVVVAAGPGRRTTETGELVPMSVKPGDTILFGKWSGNEIKINDETLLVMKEEDIIGVLIKG